MENSFFLQTLLGHEWNVQSLERHVEFKDLAEGKIEKTSNEFKKFISSYEICSNKEDNVWFLSVMDYGENTDSAFPWNEFENQSKENVNGSDLVDVQFFWNAHLPILMSVKDGYRYVAIGIEDNNKGEIFYGDEPEYEEAVLIANSFSEFKENYVKALDGDFSSDPYRFIV